MRQKAIMMATLLAAVQSQTRNLTENPTNSHFLSDNKELVIILLFLILLAAALYLDKRNHYHYVGIAREKVERLFRLLRERLQRRATLEKEKLSGDDAIPTSKDMQTNIFDSEKTYIQADISSIQEAADFEKKLEAASSMELQEQAPKVDLREVFGQKDGQNSKRSKSKIRGRVQIKKSQRESEDSQETKESKEGDSFEIGGDE